MKLLGDVCGCNLGLGMERESRPLVLVTNDDGYNAKGLQAVVKQLEVFAGLIWLRRWCVGAASRVRQSPESTRGWRVVTAKQCQRFLGSGQWASLPFPGLPPSLLTPLGQM